MVAPSTATLRLVIADVTISLGVYIVAGTTVHSVAAAMLICVGVNVAHAS